MNDVANILMDRIVAGLKRRSMVSCAKWAENCRVMGKPFPGPWTFKYHPWLRAMHDSRAEFNVGMKSAQAGYTETVLNITFHKIDIERTDCLYVLPAKTPDASDFSAARFDPALEMSPYLHNLFSDVKNIGHKRAGSTNLYIRGSKSRAGLKSVPVGFLVLDELEEMDQDNVPLAMERQSGQRERSAWAISTPRIDNRGIHKLFQASSQEHYFFKCPSCSRLTELCFPDCLEVCGENLDDVSLPNSHLKCKECKAKLIHQLKYEWLADGQWVPKYPARTNNRGFHVNQLYSSTVSPLDLAIAYLRSIRNPADEQEFYNSKLGLPHTVDGARVTDEQIQSAISNHKNGEKPRNRTIITMGIDVGRWLHYEINGWVIPNKIISDLNVESKCFVIHYGKCQHFHELDILMNEFLVNYAVIDANPESRMAYEFSARHRGRVKMCYYIQGITGKKIQVVTNDERGYPTIKVDRTSWIDMSLGRFRSGMIKIPIDTNLEYKDHIKSLVRIYEKDRDGNPVGRYTKDENEQDHYAHARTYSEIALPFAMGLGRNQDIVEAIL